METFYPIQVIVLRFQVVHVNPKKNQPFEDNRGDLDQAHIDARIFTILIRRREVKNVSDGNKKIESKIS